MSLLELSDQIAGRPDGYRSTWGIVSTTDPLTVALQGVGLPVPIDWQSEAAAPVDADDKVLVRRHGQGGWIYVDRIVPASDTAPGVGITSLQPYPTSPPPGAAGGETIPVDASGQFPRFARMNAPTNVRITDVAWNRFTVRYDYTRSTNPAAPTETGFQIDIIELSSGDVVTTEYATTAERNKIVGSLEGGKFYRARVRAITTQAQFGTYTRPQIDYLLSHYDQTIVNYYSQWAQSAQQQTDDPPVAAVAPPINLRWSGLIGTDNLLIHWDYQPLPGFATATGFQVKVCQNSLGSLNCRQNLVAPTARRSRISRLPENTRHWGFVRTVAGSRYSNWIPVGPPRATYPNYFPQIRNLQLRRLGTTDTIEWQAEVRNATELSTRERWQQQVTRSSVLTNVGPLLDNGIDPFHKIGGVTSDTRWYTVSGRDEIFFGVGVFTKQVIVKNTYGHARLSASLPTRALPGFLSLSLTQLGNRVHSAIIAAVTTVFPLGFIARAGASALRGLWRIGRILTSWRSIRFNTFSGVSRGQLFRAALKTAGSAAAKSTGAALTYGVADRVRAEIIGVRIEFGASYIGWETIDWQLGVRLPGTGTFTTDYTGTITQDYSTIPGEPRWGSQSVSPGDVFNIFETRYYAPGAEVRIRTRARNEVGVTDWSEQTYTSTDFLNPLSG